MCSLGTEKHSLKKPGIRERTETEWFSHLLWHPARKQIRPILSTPEPECGVGHTRPSWYCIWWHHKQDASEVGTSTGADDFLAVGPYLYILPLNAEGLSAANNSIVWLGSVVVRVLDLQSAGRGFDSRPPHCWVATLGKSFTRDQRLLRVKTDCMVL